MACVGAYVVFKICDSIAGQNLVHGLLGFLKSCVGVHDDVKCVGVIRHLRDTCRGVDGGLALGLSAMEVAA